MAGKSRPILIAIIAIITMLAGILLIAAGLGLNFLTIDVFVGTQFESWLSGVGVGTILMGIIALIIGFGIWKGWKIMWIIAMILYLISAVLLIVSLVLMLMDGETIGAALLVPLAICLIILFYLTRKKVKEFFGVGG